MATFTGLIKCNSCKKNYKFKNERKKPVYICGGFANYGKEFCSYYKIEEEELIYTISKHLALMGKRIEGDIAAYVRVIEVDTKNEGYTIIYTDGSESIISSNRLKY